MEENALLQRNRWLSFDDSWSVQNVADAFNVAHIANHDVVIDPFIGCGTTALVALSRGVTIYGGDLSALAVFVTQMKCAQIDSWDAEQIRAIFQQYTWSELAQAIHQRMLLTLVPAPLVIPVLRCFVVATYRTGWQLDGDIPAHQFNHQMSQLCTYIEDDIAQQQSYEGTCAVFCDDFRNLLEYMPPIASGVMITSPPFYGSQAHRLRTVFDTVLKPYLPVQAKQSPTFGFHGIQELSAEMVARHMVGVETLPEYNQVHAYILFLYDVVEFAVHAKCRAVVIEMGPKLVQNRWIYFEQIVSEILQQRGFVVACVDEVHHTTERIFRIYAHTRS